MSLAVVSFLVYGYFWVAYLTCLALRELNGGVMSPWYLLLGFFWPVPVGFFAYCYLRGIHP